MEILNLGGASDNNSSAPKARKKLGVLLGIGAVAAVTGIGSTLAANISLNSATAGAVEFGQGVVTTAACDSDGIDVAPIATFDNTASVFELTSIELSGIAAGCAGKYFTIKAYDEAGGDPLGIDGEYGNSYVEIVSGTTMSIYLDGTALADSIYKITIESTDEDPNGA